MCSLKALPQPSITDWRHLQKNTLLLVCAVPENTGIHNPLQKGLKFPGGLEEFCKTKTFKEMYEGSLEFSDEWGGEC